MELRSYLLAVKAGWKILVGAVLLAAVAAVLLSRPGTPSYSTSTTLFVAAQNGGENLNELYQRNALAQQRVFSYVELVTSGSVADQVSDEVGYDVGSATVGAALVTGTVVMEITVTDSDPDRAREIAQGYATVVPRAIEQIEQVQDTDGEQLQAVVIDEADQPGSPVPEPVLRNVVACLTLGLGLGVMLAVLIYVLREQKAAEDRRKVRDDAS